MAEILALGISHYPPLSGHDETMSGILKHMLQNPALPEKLKTPDGWPDRPDITRLAAWIDRLEDSTDFYGDLVDASGLPGLR